MSNDTKEVPSTHTSVNLGLQASASTAKISTARLPILKAPGSESNYLNWKKVVLRVLKSAKVNHVLTPVAPNSRPATWEEDNDLVCAVLVQIVDETNLRHLADEDNAAKIWDNLSRAHQDSSTGGRVYWIRKLVNARMEGNNIHLHIESLANLYERLNALVTPTKPLTPDDVHTAALLSSIPPDWLHCVSALMNQEGVKAEIIISALKNEAIRRESHGDIISVSSTKANSSKAPPPTNPSKGPRNDAAKKPRRCPLCNNDSHDLNSCNNTRKLIADHKAAQKARWEASQQDKGSSSSKPAARAGRTSAATLGQSSHKYDEDDDSDYSGLEVEVTAGNAVVSLSIPSNPVRGGDANIDSGCSMSMTPDITAVDFPKPDRTPHVRLADHSTVESSHKGLFKLPLSGERSVKSLVVPSLHEPLLSVAALCDEGLTVVFTKTSCDFLTNQTAQITGELAGRGYRRGNLYYLPSEP
ncbi:hypothetical protein PTTG_30442, partial [Puccinia triticina 1-1 BBBD Race 1]